MGGVKRQKRLKSIKKRSDSDSDSHDDHTTNKKNMNILKCSNSSSSSSSFNRFSELPQDLMLAILTLLPLKCLLNAARYVCKPWATAIRACLRLKPPGLYVLKIWSTKNSYFLNIQDHVNGKPERIHLGTPSKMGRITATCHGILLLYDQLRLTFAVNPILKSYFRIPIGPTDSKLDISSRSTIARVPRTYKFKLFVADVLNVSGVNWFVFYVLRIGVDNTWKVIARKQAIILKSKFLWDPVYSGENDIYWITSDGVIVMDVDREIIIREYPLPPPRVNSSSIRVFLWMGDRLSCIVAVKGISRISRTYEIYTLDFDSGKWTLYHEMGPFDYWATCRHELDFDINITTVCVMFRFWINDQIFFANLIKPPKKHKAFSGMKRVYFCYNVKTRQLTRINGIAVGDFEAWLHTNTLVSLPSTPT